MAELGVMGIHQRPTSTVSLLRFEGVALHRSGEPEPKFSNLSFMLPPASCVVLSGALGCGKSSALRMIVGKEPTAAGRIEVEQTWLDTLDEAGMDALRQRIGYVPEHGALLNNLNVFQNMMLPYRYHAEPTEAQVQERAAETLELLNMPPLPRVSPPAASSTLRRQVALGRALILRPKLLVLDAPVAGMDHISARDLWRTLNRLMLSMPLSIVIACDFPPQQANLEHRLIDLNKHGPRWKG